MHYAGYTSTPGGYLADIFWAAILALLLVRSPWWIPPVLLLGWIVLYLGNASFIQAMGVAVDYRDLGYLIDPQFVIATLGSNVWLSAVAAAVCIAAVFLMGWKLPARPASGRPMYISAVVVMVLVYVQFQSGAPSHWGNSSFFSLLIADLSVDREAAAEASVAVQHSISVDPAGIEQFELGQARNVLLVVVEGVHGAYLPQVAERNRVEPSVYMKHAGQWAQRGWMAPEFMVHVRQTNRGLYAMLCGDTPRLDGGQPKSMELLDAPQEAQACLPNILKRQGYNTAYIQAADLQFMSKDLVMPQLGFEKVVGKEGFADRGAEPGTGFSWGPTDEAFFRQAVPKIEALQASGQPWFATLLTVGTHYPYGVTDEEIEAAGAPRDAAVMAADRALEQLLVSLQEKGLLEDTLVIVTSDESHGLPGHWLGKNWGLFFALAPDLNPGEQIEIHSSIDIPNSILDYLQLFPQQRTAQGRSIFRRHDAGRSLMFAAATLRERDEEGLIVSCTGRVRRDGSNLDRECISLRSASGRLFDSAYDVVDGNFHDDYLDFWQAFQASEYRLRDRKQWQLLTTSRHLDLTDVGNNLALAHHRVDIPENSLLTIDVELAYDGDQVDGLAVDWVQMGVGGTVSHLPTLKLPAIKDSQQMRVRYVLPHYGPAVQSDFIFKLRRPATSGRLTVENYRFASVPQEGGREYRPRVYLESATARLTRERFLFQPSDTGPGEVRAMQVDRDAREKARARAFIGAQEFEAAQCREREFSVIENRVIQAYLIYYNRPADPGGLAYWSGRVADYRYEVGAHPAGDKAWLPDVDKETQLDEAAFANVITAFAQSDEYTRFYSHLDTQELVNNLYQQLFGQPAPAERLRHYSNAVKAGTLSRELIAMDIVQTANEAQRAIFEARLAVSRRYTTQAELSLPERLVPAPLMSLLVSDTTAAPESANTACQRIHYLMATSPHAEVIEGSLEETNNE